MSGVDDRGFYSGVDGRIISQPEPVLMIGVRGDRCVYEFESGPQQSHLVADGVLSLGYLCLLDEESETGPVAANLVGNDESSLSRQIQSWHASRCRADVASDQ